MKTNTNREAFTLPENAPEEIRKIFDYIVSRKDITFGTSLPYLRQHIKEEYLPTLNLTDDTYQKYVEKIKDFIFYSQVWNDLPEKIQVLLWALDNFRLELIIMIDLKHNKNRKRVVLIRMVSPPLEAYKYIAFSKADIIDTGRSFGLLFQ